jgi:uncharacterized protein YjdB
MNFKFKLSRRLARMKVVLLAGAIALGCKLTSTGPAAGLITGINIAPAHLTLLTSQAANLTVVVISSKTDSVAKELAQGSLQWSTTGGTVSNNGLADGVRHMTYSAPAQPGTYLLVINTITGWPADTATMTVTSTPVPVGNVSVTPGSVSLVPNDTTTLSATLTDGSGSVIVGRPITWSSSDESIATVVSTTGYVRAVTSGTVTITATCEDHSGTATVTVTQ